MSAPSRIYAIIFYFISSARGWEARAAAIVAVADKNIPVFEYEPNKIKKALTGAGHADKGAVDKMVQILLPNAHPKTPDEADAIAIALAHTNTMRIG